MVKNIIFCADGTWNNPFQDSNSDHVADPTNVYKTFMNLEGQLSHESVRSADEQEKIFTKNDVVQIAKYIHGVGDSRNILVKLMGGVFGSGLISRIVRGYTFLSRNYTPDSSIYIIGFSRGAYTARALAGLIASVGLLGQHLLSDKEMAYRYGAEAWYRYRKNSMSKNLFAGLVEAVADLPAFVSRDFLKDSDFIPVDSISCVAVWDTVGAMGIPEYAGGGKGRVDAFKFTNTKLSSKVKLGIHAVSLDEQRMDFTPTLWDSAPNVSQVLFPGAHSDVGGGYPMINSESGLSDGSLKWMTQKLSDAGIIFSKNPSFKENPDPVAPAHKPWNDGIWTTGIRKFPKKILDIHPSIGERMKARGVKHSPNGKIEPYKPKNLPV